MNKVFTCKKCGKCCEGFGGTYVNSQNIQAIAKFINVDPKKFISQYCDLSGSRYVLKLGTNGYCIFFDKKQQCTIHDLKPPMCKAWPFIKAVKKHPENWNIIASSCPGMKKI